MIRRVTPHPRKDGREPFIILTGGLAVGDNVFAVCRIIGWPALYIIGNRCIIVGAVEERTLAILLTIKIIEQGEGIRRVVLIHRRIGR